MNETRLPTGLDKFLMIEDDGVFYIGHASALVRISGYLYLFDPVWDHKPYGDYWTFYPKQVNCDRVIEKITAAFVSHIHEDHVCDSILSKMRNAIYIKDGRLTLVNRLGKANGYYLFEKPAFKWFPVSPKDEVEAYFVPHAFNSIDSSVFIRSKDYCVYVGSDNFLSKELLLKVAGDVPKVDVAMVPYAFVHWYPHLVMSLSEEKREAEIQRLNKQSLDQARDFITALRPKMVIPFGNNLFYSDAQDHFLNRSLAKPEDFYKEHSISTGDFVVKINDNCSEVFHDDPPRYPFEAKKFPAIEAGFTEITKERVALLKSKLGKAKPIGEPHLLIVNDLAIDLNKPDLTVVFDPKVPSTEFKFNERELIQWLDGEITFEQAIGTRRFQCYRTPEQYNLKVFEFMNNYL